MNKIEIKKITPKDAALLRNIRVALVKENPITFGVAPSTEKRKPLSYFGNWITRDSSKTTGIFLVVLNGIQYIGMREIKQPSKNDPTTGYIGSSGILAEYQGKGFGRMLWKQTINWIEKNTKFTKLKMIVRKTNKKYLAFIKPYGFIVTGEGSYRGVGEYYLEAKITDIKKGITRE